MTSAQKKALLWAGVVFGIMAVVIPVSLVIGRKVNHPDRHNESRFGVVTVLVGDEWTQYQRSRIDEAMRNMSRLGPTFRVVRSGRGDLHLRKGDWSTRDNESSTSPTSACRAMGSGNYELGSSEVWVDPGCTPGPQFVAAVMHETGHWIGMGHVCNHPNESARTRCSTVGTGPAFMNPNTAYGDDEIGFDTAATGPIATTEPTPLDISEFDRAWPAFRQRWGRNR